MPAQIASAPFLAAPGKEYFLFYFFVLFSVSPRFPFESPIRNVLSSPLVGVLQSPAAPFSFQLFAMGHVGPRTISPRRVLVEALHSPIFFCPPSGFKLQHDNIISP